MTWRRIVSRNGLRDGDYDKAPHDWALNCNMQPEAAFHMAEHWRQALASRDRRIQSLAGDLRRLERDVLDEKVICDHIARRTNVHQDVVAAVLQEFLNY